MNIESANVKSPCLHRDPKKRIRYLDNSQLELSTLLLGESLTERVLHAESGIRPRKRASIQDFVSSLADFSIPNRPTSSKPVFWPVSE
jgi:hypothetical protein